MKAEERWRARFRAPRMTLPTWARHAPHRAVYRSNASGTWEVYAWDRSTGQTRQVTDRPTGTSHCAVDPAGQWIWWFDDLEGDGFGVWMRQPFHGGDDVPVPVPPGYPRGLALAADGTAAVGRSGRDGFEVLLVPPDREPVTVYRNGRCAGVADMSLDGSLIAISHGEHGDAVHPALRVVRPTGQTVGELLMGNDGRFAPVPGDRRMLVLHERRGRREPLVWDPVTGEQREIWLPVRGEIDADWYCDGRALLIVHHHRGRTELLKYDLAGGGLSPIDSPRGVIEAAATRPDGTVEYSWSSAAHPPVIRSSNGHIVTSSGRMPPPSVPLEDVEVPGPAGRIHALISRPEGVSPPYPSVFLLHDHLACCGRSRGAQDDDSFQPDVAAWVDSGFAVIRVNYRGSAGYGTAWRDAARGDAGRIELADVAAVRDWAIEHGVADPERLIVSGARWGGHLTLLALGTQPKAWAAGIATMPIADHTSVCRHPAEAPRPAPGGSPEEEPAAATSPIAYAGMVQAPLLIIIGENDPRHPTRQVDDYLRALADHGHPASVYRYDAGHGAPAAEERIRQMAASIDFAVRALSERG